MFGREGIARGHRCLCLVESVREDGRVPVALPARHSERSPVPDDMEAGRPACVRIGGPLLFGRLWDRPGPPGDVVKELPDGRGFGFEVERAVFASVLHPGYFMKARFDVLRR